MDAVSNPVEKKKKKKKEVMILGFRGEKRRGLPPFKKVKK